MELPQQNNSYNWEEIWTTALAEWQLFATRPFFETCLKHSSILETEIKNNQLYITLGIPNPFWQDEIKRRFHPRIVETFNRLTGMQSQVEYVVAPKELSSDYSTDAPLFSDTQANGASEESDLIRELKKARLEPERSLENYAVSSSNEMAYAAAKAVAQRPGAAYNPLFLYGGVGVGKTHLMQGIGQFILKENLSTKIFYCTGEDFTNSIIEAIQKKSTASFRIKYRNVKLLLIDDIQFIAGKTSVQEEFFHTFNAITSVGGQIIMTSDKPPKEIDSLEDRLRSRFEGGLTIDIGEPNFELRSAILMIKAEQLQIKLPPDVVAYIASHEEDTRALVGKLVTLSAMARDRGVEINLALAQDVIKFNDSPLHRNSPPTPDVIINKVSHHYNQPVPAVLGKSRVHTLALPRHISMYFLKEINNMNLVEIGKRFSGRDHTSVIHAIKKVDQLISKDPKIMEDITKLRAEFQM